MARGWRRWVAVVSLAGAGTGLAACGGSSASSSSSPSAAGAAAARVTWMAGVAAPGTPAQYDKVGVVKVGPADARNVLVLEPGTSAGAGYFVPLARWVVARDPGWQVWSVERRENLLEDQSEMDLAKEGKATAAQLFDYYLGYLKDPSITHHVQPLAAGADAFAKQWGMAVAVDDLHNVVAAAKRLGGKVVLGGHSLGGSVVTAYATWDFGGRPGADDLAGLVLIDGASQPTAVSAALATQELAGLDAPSASPWLAFGGIAAPYAGLFVDTGAEAALIDPDGASLGQSSGLLDSFHLTPSVPVTNLGQFGYALNVATSPADLAAAQAHLGAGLASSGSPRGWDGKGALTPITRFAQMFAGTGLVGVDGSEWYFPQRLTDDTGAVADGNANPAQAVLGLKATMGHDLPKSLRILAFGAALGGPAVPAAARTLAAQSGIPASHLTLVDDHTTYAHNDPAGAYPTNAFVAKLVPFLGGLAR